MARTTYVASARASKHGRPNCYTCHEPIEVGQSYAWNQPSRYSPKYSWHTSCTPPRPSVLESNEKRGAAMAAFEDGYESLSALRDEDRGEDFDPAEFLEQIRDNVFNTVAEGVREAAEMWREAASNIEDGFGHPTEMSEEFESNADEVDGVADEVESIELDEYDPEQWDDIEQWVDDTLENASDELGSLEGNLP